MNLEDKISRVKRALLSMQRYSWEQGVTMQAFLELGDSDVVVTLAKESVYRSIPDGRTAIIGTVEAVTDPCAVGEALLWAGTITKDEDLRQGAKKLLDWTLNIAPRNNAEVLYHLIDKKEFWIDSMYMLPPFLAAAGYYEEALTNMNGYINALYDKEKHLMHHMWDDEKNIYTREAYWGVGNGWALAGLARVIDLLPQNMETQRKELEVIVVELLHSVLTYRREDGLFHDILDDSNTFVETNLSQMVAYTIYRGILSGWLPKDMEQEALICRKAANEKVDSYGFVQDVCGAPTFDKPGVAAEGQAFYLLMEAAASKFKI